MAAIYFAARLDRSEKEALPVFEPRIFVAVLPEDVKFLALGGRAQETSGHAAQTAQAER